MYKRGNTGRPPWQIGVCALESANAFYNIQIGFINIVVDSITKNVTPIVKKPNQVTTNS